MKPDTHTTQEWYRQCRKMYDRYGLLDEVYAIADTHNISARSILCQINYRDIVNNAIRVALLKEADRIADATAHNVI